jgi:hypothetical protein
VKRLALLVLALAAFAPATANAAAPCRDRIYNDWYADGKIATTYPLACYRDALKNIPADAKTYSDLAADIRSAMQGARERLRGDRQVPTQIGKGGGTMQAASRTTKSATKPGRAPHDPAPGAQPVSQTLPSSKSSVGATGGGSSVPVPLLVLGALALLLIAVGGVGAVAKRRRT